MARRTIKNENDITKLIADSMIKCLNGKISETKLNALSNAGNIYFCGKKQIREAVRAKKNQAVVDGLRDELEEKLDSLGHRISYHQQLSNMKMK